MHIIKICQHSSCERNFAKETLKRAEEILQIKAGETTPDGDFRLETCGCLSNCDNGPNVLFMEQTNSKSEAVSPLSMIMPTGKVENHMRPDKIEQKISALRENIHL